MVLEGDHQFGEEDDVVAQINWDNLLDGLPDCDGIFDSDPSPFIENGSNSSPDSVSSWIGEIENMLMKDDDGGDLNSQLDQQACTEFLAEILADSPVDASGEVVDASTEKDSSDSENCGGGAASPEAEEEEEKEKATVADHGTVAADEDDTEDPDDPVSKKRRRQLRNRDAAVRSRERKKMYVKDLELKSKYLEGECRRLDRLLQCFIAENQALRLTVQKYSAFGVASAKQESAVLLLESLLLGSLLWFLGIMCLFTLPALPQSALLEVPVGNGEKKAPEKVALNGARSRVFRSSLVRSFLNSRRCKASRTKMRTTSVSMTVTA
ncbi:hypothetical protein Tsubulata_039033 [Turnera subulata]|uniref:BZIP domain-containing protein n=1 Tax=Turnera subulata TaxID=218843 RepID=A0A9Q0J7H1_9ROSI|nr:hypothetical protein Tsubulata_039033 [Turnera subulata]